MIDDDRLSMDAHHVYRLETSRGETILPSVTQILSDVGLLNVPETETMKEYARRGTMIHQALAIIDSGKDLDWSTVPAGIVGYIESYKAFLIQSGFVAELIEQKVFSEKFLYAGTIDRYGKFRDGTKTLLDIKTGNSYVVDWMNLQLAGYYVALTEKNAKHIPQKRMILHIADNVKYRLTDTHLGEPDIQDFLAAVRVYHRKRR